MAGYLRLRTSGTLILEPLYLRMHFVCLGLLRFRLYNNKHQIISKGCP